DGTTGKFRFPTPAAANRMGNSMDRTHILFFRMVAGEFGSPRMAVSATLRMTSLFLSAAFPAGSCMPSPRTTRGIYGSPINTSVFFVCPKEARYNKFLGPSWDVKTLLVL